MSVVINGTGSISGLSNVGGITSAQSGSVIQTVYASYSTQVTNTTTTPAATNLTASITPQFSTSKILVLISQPCSSYAVSSASSDVGVSWYLQRNGSNIYNGNLGPTLYFYGVSSSNWQIGGIVNLNYLDSPATTSSTTYSTSFCNTRSGASGYANYGNQVSTITLLEIAQ